jgi:hypothetical protein
VHLSSPDHAVQQPSTHIVTILKPAGQLQHDFDFDGAADLALFRAGDGRWRLRLSASGFLETREFAFGRPEDEPVAGPAGGVLRSEV